MKTSTIRQTAQQPLPREPASRLGPRGGSKASGARQLRQHQHIAQLQQAGSHSIAGTTQSVIQARRVVNAKTREFLRDADDKEVLQDHEAWEDELISSSSHEDANPSPSSQGTHTPHIPPTSNHTTIDIGGSDQQQDPLTLPPVSSLIKTTNKAIVTVQGLGEGMGMDSGESVDSPRLQSNTLSITEMPNLHRRSLDIESGEQHERDQQQRRGPRRKPLTLARFVSGIGAPLIEIGALLAAAIGTTLDATGKGPAFFTGVAIIIIAGLKAIADDVKKNEDNPRTWGGRVLHTVGALTPSLMTIPIGIAGTKYGTDTMNVPVATWLPFAIGVIAILMVHLVKLIKWISRS